LVPYQSQSLIHQFTIIIIPSDTITQDIIDPVHKKLLSSDINNGSSILPRKINLNNKINLSSNKSKSSASSSISSLSSLSSVIRRRTNQIERKKQISIKTQDV